MHFDALLLRAYGPFTERRIDLAPPGVLQILVGPNEAGKSSTMRAIESLLFGFAERTPDNFVHDYKALRVGASLSLADGSALHLMRRKQRKNTLFAFDPQTGQELTDSPVADEVLSRLVGALDAASYRRLYGLDLDGLEEGGRALVEGEGDLGRSLFQAAAGLSVLKQVSKDLDSRAGELFRPRASTSLIHQSLRALEECSKRTRELAVRAATWTDEERELRRQQKVVDDERQRLTQLREQARRLERLQACLPLAMRIVQADEALAALAAAGSLPVLAADAPERRVLALERLRTAELELELARQDAQQHRDVLARSVDDESLLALASQIERLHHGADAYREAAASIAPLRSRLALLRRSLLTQARQVDPAIDERLAPAAEPADDLLDKPLQALLPDPAFEARLDGLTAQALTLAERQQELASRIAETVVEAEQLAQQLAQAPQADDGAELPQALAEALPHSDLARRIDEIAAVIARQQQELAADVASFSDWPVAATLAVRGPLQAQLEQFAESYRQLIDEDTRIGAALTGLERDRLSSASAMRELTSQGPVITRADLQAARQLRDEQWQQIRDGGLVPASPQAYEFESSLTEADRRADLLQDNAARAARLLAQQRRAEDLVAQQASLDAAAAALQGRRDALDQAWQACCAGLPPSAGPRSPEAVREWLRRQRAAAQLSLQLAGRQAELDGLRTTELAARQKLMQALVIQADPAPALANLIRLAQQRLAGQGEARALRLQLAQRLDDARSRLRVLQGRQGSLQAEREQFGLAWSCAMRSLHLAPDALPAEVVARRQQLDRLRTELTGWLDEQLALTRAQDLVQGYREQAQALAAGPGAGVSVEDAAACADQLYQRLAGQRQVREQAQRAQAGLQGAQEREQRAVLQRSLALADLEALRVMAGAAHFSELPAIEARCASARQWQHNHDEAQRLLTETGGQPLDELMAQLRGQDPDALVAAHLETEDAIKLQLARMELSQAQLTEAQRRFAVVDGRADAAQAAQEGRELEAELAGQVQEYLRQRMAQMMLDRVVVAYRDRHQAPLLRRAGELFGQITGGRYLRLITDHDDDRQLLLAERADGARLTMAALSQGARHQLFLALRIAAIESRLDQREPVPVIIDDLLVQFDDTRALATLQVLADLARSTQVVYFTHHVHLAQLAMARLPAGRCVIQTLVPQASTPTLDAGDTARMQTVPGEPI